MIATILNSRYKSHFKHTQIEHIIDQFKWKRLKEMNIHTGTNDCYNFK